MYFTNGITKGIVYWLYDLFTDGITDGIMPTNTFFIWHALSICNTIGDNITDIMTDKIEITNDKFFLTNSDHL
jgi:hypothetical protein